MPAFLVGTVRILDAEAFARYGAAIKGLSARFGGESIVAGLVTEVMEGGSPVGERVVVSRFPSAENARAYLTSPDYLAAGGAAAGVSGASASGYLSGNGLLTAAALGFIAGQTAAAMVAARPGV